MSAINHIELKDVQVGSKGWSNLEKIAFRFAFIFFLLLTVPLQVDWYKKLLSSESFYDLLETIASGIRFAPVTVTTESGRWGFAAYAPWGVAILIGGISATIWTILSRNSKKQEYNALYYWLRVIVRYRVALGLIAFGFWKFFPMQMPFPSVSNLHTDIGDYAGFKLYWQQVGVSVKYEIFLGFLEIAAGSLLLFRSTIALGAIVNAGVLFNIAHANLAYDGSVHVYASYFVLLSLFLLVQYLPNIWKLFIKGEAVKPVYYYPDFHITWKKSAYYATKVTFIFLFVFVYAYYRYDLHYNKGWLKEPLVPGLLGAGGHYDVTTFVLNGDTIQYSPQDSLRWHDAVFERYSTLVYKVNKPLSVSLGNGGPRKNDILKNYELTGRSGGKTYLYYEIDSSENKLYLVDKNQSFSAELNKQLNAKNDAELKKLYRTSLRDSLNIIRWNYSRPTKDKMVLSGIDFNKDSIYVVLDKLNEKYLTGKEWHTKNNKYTY